MTQLYMYLARMLFYRNILLERYVVNKVGIGMRKMMSMIKNYEFWV